MKFFHLILSRFLGPFYWGRKSYSQEGEDLIIDRILSKKNGFYVDVGCHHPFRFSNTYLFYKKGWCGIGIDALPGTKKLFNRWRSRDITIEMGVSSEPGHLTYYAFNEPALNTFDSSLAKQRDGKNGYHLVKEFEVKTARLGDILKTLSCRRDIDFLTIDVEGFDLMALESLDWDAFHPKIVIAECYVERLDFISDDQIFKFLHSKGYEAFAKTGHSVIFVNKSYLNPGKIR
jgi:FkbM family methyltransferase